MISFDCRLDRDSFRLDAAFEGAGGVTGLFGPSGSGKSTIIRLIAGLERPRQGRIALGDRVLVDRARGINLPPHRRRIGLVFQDAQLFPHLTVRQNLTYGRWFNARSGRRISFDGVVGVLGVGHLLDKLPNTLSGGERQRVAIGRAMLAEPDLLVMDEPLASLDPSRKLEILPFIEGLRDEFATPILYVSHAVEEIARLSSTVVRLDGGKVVAAGPPGEILAPTMAGRATDRFDAVSMLTATFDRYDADYGVTLLSHPAGMITVPGGIAPSGRAVRVAIRATGVTLAIGRPGELSIRTSLQGRITRIESDGGPFALVSIELTGGDRIHAYVTRLAVDDLGLGEGDRIQALVKAVSIDERGVSNLRVVE